MGTLRIFMTFLYITGNQQSLCMDPGSDRLALDNIVLWEDSYLKDPCSSLDQRLAILNNAANHENLHGIFLQLFYMTQHSKALERACVQFYQLNQQQNTLAECYPYVIRTFRFIHRFLRKTSDSLSFFSDSGPLQQIYFSQKLDWAEPLVQLSQIVYDQIVAINLQHQLDRTDLLLCIEQQEELIHAREHSPAYALDFYCLM